MFKIAIKYMKYQKKNYIATILVGIVAVAILMISLVLHEYDLNERENFYNKDNPKFNIKVSATQDIASNIIGKSDKIQKITVVNENLNLNVDGQDLRYKVYDKDNNEDVLKIDILNGRLPENSNEVIISEAIFEQFPNMQLDKSIIGNVENIKYDKDQISEVKSILAPEYGLDSMVDYSEVVDELESRRNFVPPEDMDESAKEDIRIKYSKEVISNNNELKIVGIYKSKCENKKSGEVISLDTKENIMNTNTVKTYYCDYDLGSKSVQEVGWRKVRYDSDMYLQSLELANNINSSENGICTAVPQNKNEVRNSLGVTAFISELSPITIAIFIGLFTVMAMTNAFNMCINERIRQIGTLKALGASPMQILKMVIYEIIIMMLISFPIGIGVGALLSKAIIFVLKNNYGYGEYAIGVNSYIEMILICLGMIVFSLLLASNSSRYKAKKLTAVEAMTSSKMYKKEDIVAENSKFINKHFGIEVILADKDVSCNAEKYRMCFISLAIGMIFLMLMFNKTVRIGSSQEYELKSTNWNVEISNTLGAFNEKDINEIKQIEGVKTVYNNISQMNNIKLPKNRISNEMLESISVDGNDLANQERSISIDMVYGDEALFNISKNYIKSGEIDYSNLKDNDIVLVNNGYILSSVGRPQFIENIVDYKVGDKIIFEDDTEYNIVAIISENPIKNISNNISSEELQSRSNISIIIPNKYNQIPIKSLYLEIDNENRESIMENLNTVSVDKKYQLMDYKESKDNINVLNKRYTILDVIFTLSLVIIVLLNLVNTLNLVTLSRKGELAALRAIGMEVKQLKRHLISEGMIICFYSICTSLLIGGCLILLTQKSMVYGSTETYIAVVLLILFTVVLQLIIGILSAILPLRKIIKLSIADEMRV